jgi:ferredoxin
MLHELASQHAGREVWWVHSARSPRDHPLAAEVHRLLATLRHARELLFYSATPPEPYPNANLTVHSGHLTAAKLKTLGIPPDATAYVCGPPSYMAAMRNALAETGVAPGRVQTELFHAPPPLNPGVTGQVGPAPHHPAGPQGNGPLVTFARSGISTPFQDTRPNLLDLAEACDVPTRWSCRSGVCHNCITPLVSGEVTYSPLPLDHPVEGQVLICCARPDTDIVLDM